MDVEVSLHHEPREVCITVCITEDTESIDLAWFEDKKLNRVKMALDVCYRLAFAIGKHLAHPKQWQKSWIPKRKEKTRCVLQKDHEWRNEFLFKSRLKSSRRIMIRCK